MFGWVSLAAAQSLDGRVALYEATLVAASGDLEGAIERCTMLSKTLEELDPTHAEALYWLGHSQLALGRVDDARETLLEGIRSGLCPACRDLLEELEIDATSVRTIPWTWTFDDGTNPTLFYPWRVRDDSAETIQVGAGGRADPVLEWAVVVRMGDPDRLVLGLDHPSPPPRALGFEVVSLHLDAVLDVVAEDVYGRTFALADPIEVPRGFPRRVVVPLGELRRTSAGADPVGVAPGLDPGALVTLAVVDRTATRRSGPNRFRLDDFTLE